jgi:mono/diheme cytochrome c family protein
MSRPDRSTTPARQQQERQIKKRDRRFIARGLLIAAAGFALLQLVPYGRNHTNPPVVSEPQWDNPETRDLVNRACFDCHSDETIWPWYSHVAPASMLLQRDVDEGRKALNFSTWRAGRREQAEIEEIVATISKGQMPPSYYLILHPEARLTDAQKGQLVNGLITTMGGDLESDELKEDTAP